MKTFLCCIFLSVSVFAQNQPSLLTHQYTTGSSSEDSVSELTDLLSTLALNSDNQLFKKHCLSIINIIADESDISLNEAAFLNDMYITFADTSLEWNAGKISTYTERKRPLILSWRSPTDSIVSLGWLLLPENWKPEQSYPLYVYLHGLNAPYANKIEYMTRYFKPDSLSNKTFENGYSFYPWGRGNIWYEGIGETDIWEGISAVESLTKIDTTRKYLVGHSMGGYGAWALGQKSPGKWAAIGVYAGALWYNNYRYLNAEGANKLKDVPVYIVCGDQDGLLGNNQTAFQLLQQTGNTKINFVTFHGGHESLLENWQNMYAWIKDWQNEGISSLESEKNKYNYQLFNNYPNPFNPSTRIRYQIANNKETNSIPVTLKIFDVLGNEIALLVNDIKQPGYYEIELNADGYNLTSGVYFYILNAGEFKSVKKMIYLK